MSSIPLNHIDGDVAVGRNVYAGGKASVKGDVTVGHNLRVEGWLDAPNIVGAFKGLFKTRQDLWNAYPNPQPGLYALVGNGLPADVWRSEKGTWVATGEEGGWPEVMCHLDEYVTTENEAEFRDGLEDRLTQIDGSLNEHDARLHNKRILDIRMYINRLEAERFDMMNEEEALELYVHDYMETGDFLYQRFMDTSDGAAPEAVLMNLTLYTKKYISSLKRFVDIVYYQGVVSFKPIRSASDNSLMAASAHVEFRYETMLMRGDLVYCDSNGDDSFMGYYLDLSESVEMVLARDGYDLSECDYTADDRAKLQALPTAEDIENINSEISQMFDSVTIPTVELLLADEGLIEALEAGEMYSGQLDIESNGMAQLLQALQQPQIGYDRSVVNLRLLVGDFDRAREDSHLAEDIDFRSFDIYPKQDIHIIFEGPVSFTKSFKEYDGRLNCAIGKVSFPLQYHRNFDAGGEEVGPDIFEFELFVGKQEETPGEAAEELFLEATYKLTNISYWPHFIATKAFNNSKEAFNKATEAKAAAETAQSSATSARMTAIGANTNAINAQTAADNAQTAAQTADGKAVAAQQTADTANAKADNAAKAAFIELWNQAAQYPNNLGRYNPDTDFFELNGLTDITYEEAKRIYEFKEQPWLSTARNSWSMLSISIRTNLFPIYRIVAFSILAWQMKCDIFRIAKNWEFGNNAALGGILSLPDCVKIIGGTSIENITMGLDNSPRLESFRFYGLNKSLDFSKCPKIDAASLLYMVNNSANTGAIEIKVHPDVMAKIQNASDYGDDVADDLLFDRMVVSENMSDSLTRKQFEDMNYYIGHYGDPNAKWSGVLAKITNVESLELQAGIGQVVMIGGYLKDDPYTFGLAYLEITDIEQRDGTYDMITGYPLDLTFDPWAAVRRMAAKRNISFTT